MNEKRTDLFGKNQTECLRLILKASLVSKISLFINPSVLEQINNTPDKKRKKELLLKCKEFEFEEFNLTIFPFTFPATYITEEQSALIEKICEEHPALVRDQKIIADAGFNDKIDVLLTTDKKLARQVQQVGKVKYMLPCELLRIL